MPQRHLIRLFPDDRASWLAVDREGRVASGLTDGLPAAAAEETVVLVPSADVLLLDAPRVARQRRQLEQAVPFAIEDQLAQPVEQCHVAVADLDGERVLAAVTSRASMDAWLQRLAESGCVADRMLPEVALLPWQNGPVLLIDGARASLRHARAGAFGGDVSEIEGWLAALRESGLDAPLAVHGTPEDMASARPHWQAWLPGVREYPFDQAGTFLASRLAQAGPLDLLVGHYAPLRRGAGGRRLWRWAAVLAGFGVLSGLGSLALERWQLERRYAQERTRMEVLLRDTVPGVTRIVDPRAQLASELTRLGDSARSGGALAMLARLGPVLSGSGRYTLDGIDYRNGVLDLTLRAGDVATLDQLREQAVALGFGAELTSVVPGSGGVEGKLRITGGAA